MARANLTVAVVSHAAEGAAHVAAPQARAKHLSRTERAPGIYADRRVQYATMLCELMDRVGLSNRWLAIRHGVTEKVVRGWRDGTRPIPVEVIDSLDSRGRVAFLLAIQARAEKLGAFQSRS